MSEQALQKRIEKLERQLLAMREELTSISIALEGDVDGSPDASPRSSLATGVHRDIEALLISTTANLSRKYVKREVLEKCVAALNCCYDVCEWPSDGTTIQDMALAAARKELEK